jgi:hypothetical protein
VSLLFIALGLSLVGGLGGLLVASGVLLIKDSARARFLPWLVSYAVGALLGVATLKILPKRSNASARREILATLLGGILLFFVLEKLVLWRHCHTHDCEVHESTVWTVVIGGWLPQLRRRRGDRRRGDDVDSARHQHGGRRSRRTRVPQEVGDFAVLLHCRLFTRSRPGAERGARRSPAPLAPSAAYAAFDIVRTRCRISSHSPQPAFSTWPWLT